MDVSIKSTIAAIVGDPLNTFKPMIFRLNPSMIAGTSDRIQSTRNSVMSKFWTWFGRGGLKKCSGDFR